MPRQALIFVPDPLNRIITSYTDAVGRPVRVTDPLGNVAAIVYDPINELRITVTVHLIRPATMPRQIADES